MTEAQIYILVASVLLSAVLTVTFAVILKRSGPFRSAWPFFLIVLLFSWSGGILFGALMELTLAFVWIPTALIAGAVATALAWMTYPRFQKPMQDPVDTSAPPEDSVQEMQRRTHSAAFAASGFIWLGAAGLFVIALALLLFD